MVHPFFGNGTKINYNASFSPATTRQTHFHFQAPQNAFPDRMTIACTLVHINICSLVQCTRKVEFVQVLSLFVYSVLAQAISLPPQRFSDFSKLSSVENVCAMPSQE